MTSTPSSKAVFRAATSPVSAARSIAFTALLFAIVDWFRSQRVGCGSQRNSN